MTEQQEAEAVEGVLAGEETVTCVVCELTVCYKPGGHPWQYVAICSDECRSKWYAEYMDGKRDR